MTWSPRPIEIKLFSTDVQWLKQKAPQLRAVLDTIPGVVDSFDGLETTGPSLSVCVRYSDTMRFGLSSNDVAVAVSTAMLGQKNSYMLEGDRIVNIRVRMKSEASRQIADLKELPLRSLDGRTVKLSQVAILSCNAWRRIIRNRIQNVYEHVGYGFCSSDYRLDISLLLLDVLR